MTALVPGAIVETTTLLKVIGYSLLFGDRGGVRRRRLERRRFDRRASHPAYLHGRRLGGARGRMRPWSAGGNRARDRGDGPEVAATQGL